MVEPSAYQQLMALLADASVERILSTESPEVQEIIRELREDAHARDAFIEELVEDGTEAAVDALLVLCAAHSDDGMALAKELERDIWIPAEQMEEAELSGKPLRFDLQHQLRARVSEGVRPGFWFFASPIELLLVVVMFGTILAAVVIGVRGIGDEEGLRMMHACMAKRLDDPAAGMGWYPGEPRFPIPDEYELRRDDWLACDHALTNSESDRRATTIVVAIALVIGSLYGLHFLTRRHLRRAGLVPVQEPLGDLATGDSRFGIDRG
ncbi:MAG: hypothetical protein V3T86_01160 [Planctomycetota bacterium]